MSGSHNSLPVIRPSSKLGTTQAKLQVKGKNDYKYKYINLSEDAMLYPAKQCTSNVSGTNPSTKQSI